MEGEKPYWMFLVSPNMTLKDSVDEAGGSVSPGLEKYPMQKLERFGLLTSLERAVKENATVIVAGVLPDDIPYFLDWKKWVLIPSEDSTDCMTVTSRKKRDPVAFWILRGHQKCLLLSAFPGADWIYHLGRVVTSHWALSNLTSPPPTEYWYAHEARDECSVWSDLKTVLRNSGRYRAVIGYAKETWEQMPNDSFRTGWKESPNGHYALALYRGLEVGILFLEVRHTFWGDIAGVLVRKLRELGAVEIVHVAKSATMDGTNTVLAFSAPEKIVESWKTEPCRLDKYCSVRNEAMRLDHIHLQKKNHASVRSPLDMFPEKRNCFARTGSVSSVDVEVSHIAFAASETAPLRVAFVHWISDHLWSEKEFSRDKDFKPFIPPEVWARHESVSLNSGLEKLKFLAKLSCAFLAKEYLEKSIVQEREFFKGVLGVFSVPKGWKIPWNAAPIRSIRHNDRDVRMMQSDTPLENGAHVRYLICDDEYESQRMRCVNSMRKSYLPALTLWFDSVSENEVLVKEYEDSKLWFPNIGKLKEESSNSESLRCEKLEGRFFSFSCSASNLTLFTDTVDFRADNLIESSFATKEMWFQMKVLNMDFVDGVNWLLKVDREVSRLAGRPVQHAVLSGSAIFVGNISVSVFWELVIRTNTPGAGLFGAFEEVIIKALQMDEFEMSQQVLLTKLLAHDLSPLEVTWKDAVEHVDKIGYARIEMIRSLLKPKDDFSVLSYLLLTFFMLIVSLFLDTTAVSLGVLAALWESGQSFQVFVLEVLYLVILMLFPEIWRRGFYTMWLLRALRGFLRKPAPPPSGHHQEDDAAEPFLKKLRFEALESVLRSCLQGHPKLEKAIKKCKAVAETIEELLSSNDKILKTFGLREQDILALRNHGAQKGVEEPSDDVLLSQPFKVLGMEFTFEKLKDVEANVKSALGDVQSYAENKIKQAAHLDKSRKVLVVGAFDDLAWDVRKKLNAVKQLTDGTLTIRGVNTERLRVYDGKDAYVVIVPCGRGMVRCYAQSFKLAGFNNVEAYWSEQTCEENAYKEWSGVGEMQDVVEGAVVVLGAAKKMYKLVKVLPGTDKWWSKDDVVEKGNWTAYVLEGKEKKAVFLESKLSYFGDLAKTLGKALYGMGTMEIVHCGVKVGTKVDTEDVMSEVFAPKRFVLMSSMGELTEAGMSNEIGERFPASRRATHTSVESPFDEAHGLMREADKKEGIVSIDCEGAYFAIAASECGRRFGALYFASDYVRAMHEQFDGESLGKKPEGYDADKDKLLNDCGKELTNYLHLWKSQVGLAQLRNRLAAHYAARCVPLFGAWSGEHRVEMQQLYVAAKMHFEKENQNAAVETFDASELWSKASGKGAKIVLIEGVAGMGKTSLALHIAQKQLIYGQKWKVVLYVELKTLKGVECSVEGVFKMATKQLDPNGLEDVKKELSQNVEEVLWIFDGYDEIEAVVEMQELVHGLKNGSIGWVKQCIITSRPERKTRKLGKDCVIVELCEWSDAQQLEYCEKFLGKDAEAFKSLKDLLDQQGVARDLAGVPLMCEVFCVLAKAKKLPQQATSLKVVYDALHEYLMERAHDKGVNVDVNEVMRIAQENVLKGGLIELKDASLIRSGLYRRVEQGKYAMIHQSLLEYYASRSLSQLGGNALREKLELMLTMQPNQQVLVTFIGETFRDRKEWLVVYDVAFGKMKKLWKGWNGEKKDLEDRDKRHDVAKQTGLENIIELVVRLGNAAEERLAEDLFFTILKLQPIHVAVADFFASHGSLILVEALLKANPSKKTLNSMFQEAALQGHEKIVEALVRGGADKSSISLAAAARDGHVKLVKYLIKNGANPQDAVEAAAKAGRVKVLEVLNEHDLDFTRGIQVAGEAGAWDAVSLLISFKKHKAEKLDLGKIWEKGKTKEAKQDIDVLMTLADQGADINPAISECAKSGSLDQVKRLIGAKGADVKRVDLSGAVSNAKWDVAKFLAEKDADVTYVDLTRAANEGRLDIVMLLVKKGSDATKVDLYGVALNRQLNVIKYLVSMKANVNGAIMGAAAVGSLEMVQELMMLNGADAGRLYLIDAGRNGHLDVIKWLVGKGTNVNPAISGAAARGNMDLVLELMKLEGADARQVNLFEAGNNGYLDVIKVLVGEGADVNSAIAGANARGNIGLISHLKLLGN